MHRRPQPGLNRILAAMLATIAVVTCLAWCDERREADTALADLQTEQSILASSLARGLLARLATMERDARLLAASEGRDLAARYDPVAVRSPGQSRAELTDASRLLLTVRVPNGSMVDLGVHVGELLDGAPHTAREGDFRLFLSRPGDTALHGVDGQVVPSPLIRDALDRGLSALRLTRNEAAKVGLRERTAMAGLAHVDAGALGRWDVISVASAASERDREKWAMRRLVLSVLVASGLVIAFGGMALREQRKELELAHRLTISEVERERDERLLRAERVATMGTLAAGIAHEVSTPLGVIVGRAEQLLGRLEGDDRGTRSAEAILKQAYRIQQIVRRFLDMARGGPPSFARTDPSKVVRAAADSLAHRFSKADVSLVTDIPASMPEVQCDPDLLEHAIVNLLLNACEACAPGGRVEIAARSDAACVAFVVSDDGVGISSDDAARATEPFFTTKAAAGGTGLGLAIATEIAKSHRGDLTLAPNAEQGTRACIAIPIAAPVGRQG
jgi:two-component system, NtrC family, sensor kinase